MSRPDALFLSYAIFFSNEIESAAIIGIMAPDEMFLFARMEFISSLIKLFKGNWVIFGIRVLTL